jgi:hypothetical protein
MSPDKIDTPENWRKRAEETRRLANQLADPVAKQTATEIAEAYEKLAVIAETSDPGKRPSR